MKDFHQFDFSPRGIAPESEVKEVKTIIKSCITTQKGGLPINSLRDEYKSVTDEDIPYLKLGYTSLFHLLRDIPEIKSARNKMREPVLVVEATAKNQHLLDLINKQKDPKIYRRPSRKCDKRTRERQDSRRKIHDMQRNVSLEQEVSPPEDENWGRPIIHNVWDFEKNKTIYTEPMVGSTQMIGDDYFLQLCIKYLASPLERKDAKSPITCGTVQSGLTIKKATKKLDNMKTLSNKIVINLGTVDIYNRQTDADMIEDYKYLLDKLRNKYGYSPNQITLCTLPPMGNVGMFCEPTKYFNYIAFNNWLRSFATSNGYKMLDLHKEFTDQNMALDYQYFQQNARMVSGTPHPHVLWNYFGRQKVMKLILNLN